MTPRQVAVVPHTHWDREWYEPFQTFRLKLIDLLDALIPLLENDPSYAHYLLDGQMAVVDDYLEVRPEMTERLRRLAASGRIAMGPWYILVDEFLVSGETMIRDLQLGIEKGAAFGGVTSVGYLPDMFGHIAQMPQILSQAGFDDTVLWRGVPSAVTKSGFRWISPDGSSVRAEYLITGYGNGASLPADPTALVRRVGDHVNEVSSFLFDDLLLMNGSDHLLPQRHLGHVLAEANAIQDDLHFSVMSIPDYLEHAPRVGLEEWTGELRSGFRSNILMGVLSNRVDVKRLASLTERAIERRAEPYAALFGDPNNYPAAVLAIAWREIIRNAAHDSICACSVDETVDAVLHRFNEAKQIATGVAQRGLEALANSIKERGVVVANATPRSRSGIVETVVAGDEFDPAIMQLVEERGTYPDTMLLDADAMRAILSLIQDTRIDDNAWVHEVRLGSDGDDLTLDVTIGTYQRAGVELAQTRQELYSKIGSDPTIRTRVTLTQPPIRRVLTLTPSVPGFGWHSLVATAPSHAVRRDGDLGVTNGRISVVANSTDGTFSINGHAGFGRLVDVGDLGDSYNYSPPAFDQLVTSPSSVSVEVSEFGPLRGLITISSTFCWPASIQETEQRRIGEVECVVVVTLEIRADENHVRVETSFVNPARDHRLRVHMPLITPASTSRAECAFTTVERGLTAEGRGEEFGLPTFPSRRFVQAGRLTVVHEGLHEYELIGIDDENRAHEIAITLLRSTAMLSRLGMTYRPLPAGPLTYVEGLQMVGKKIIARYAIGLDVADPFAFADDILVPLDTVHAPGGGSRPASGSNLQVAGAEVSSVRRVEGVLEIRVFNTSSETTLVEIPHRSGWLVDLRGRGLEPIENSFSLRGHGIATIRLLENE